jgi:RIO kinase 1
MNDNGQPVIFDMGQSVLVGHPRAEEFLLRDLRNLNSYFVKQGVIVKDENLLLKWVTERG